MSFYQAGEKVLARFCHHFGACADAGKLYLQFTHDLSTLEMAAVREFIVEHLSSPERDLTFAGACRIPAHGACLLGQARTRMIFAVREKTGARSIDPALTALAALFGNLAPGLHGSWFRTDLHRPHAHRA